MKAKNYIDLIEERNTRGFDSVENVFSKFPKDERRDSFLYALSIYHLPESIFKSNPELWIDFDINDWEYIIINNNDRPEVIENDFRLINSQSYDDIKILNKYLNINPFSLLLKIGNSMNKKDLINCFKFGKQYCGTFYEDENFFRDTYEDSWNLSYEDLQTYSKKLLSQGCTKRPENEDELFIWLNNNYDLTENLI
ncbi:putative nucleic acid-binding OB-fold protein [Chryseobacterium defluvii]|uniref:Putative nucleic acid-binding OB-fold protein n=1 Tax=Chryseobacterium defluvii TaxID=160396 RepID=A0A840KHF4_9FLAO|nr:hypothetical protein [Chryseobacterium defluvii]MBB4806930.1 putative nucleic acid-binding OB-fold protein [Chryseobacterium defluvii]